jgi:hypothetical protein
MFKLFHPLFYCVGSGSIITPNLTYILFLHCVNQNCSISDQRCCRYESRRRDASQGASYGSHDVQDTRMHIFDLLKVQTLGIMKGASVAVKRLHNDELTISGSNLMSMFCMTMSAVDYRLESGGLIF